MKVFLEDWWAVLLLAHLFATFVLIGCLSHNLICVTRFVRGKFGREKAEARHVKWAFWSYVVTYAFGALIYPAFRIYMRLELFDEQLPWATGLFEVKEHWGAVGLAMFLAYYLLRRSFTPSKEKDKLWVYVPLCLMLNVIVWYKIVVGCYLTMLKGAF